MRFTYIFTAFLSCLFLFSFSANAQKRIKKDKPVGTISVTPFDVSETLVPNSPSSITSPKAIDASSTIGKYATLISLENLKKEIDSLSHTYFRGRETGFVGGRRTARHLASEFFHLELDVLKGDTSYFQLVPTKQETWRDLNLNVNGTCFSFGKDYFTYLQSNRNKSEEVFDKVLFLGYGIEDSKYNDYKGVKVEGKLIVIYSGEPTNKDGISYITGSKEKSQWTKDWTKKLRIAKRKKVAGVIVIQSKARSYYAEHATELAKPFIRLDLNEPYKKLATNYFVRTKVAEKLFGKRYKRLLKAKEKIRTTGKPARLKAFALTRIKLRKREKDWDSFNIYGMLKGSDPALRDEYVVVLANYDNKGMKSDSTFYPGADANATGTAGLVELAKAFAQAKADGNGPRRSILFLATSGHYKGKSGINYYMDSPIVPLEKTVAVISLEQIGQNNENAKNLAYVLGGDRTSSDLNNILNEANDEGPHFTLDYTLNAEDDGNALYERSEISEFKDKKIPALSLLGSLSENQHTTDDTELTIDYEKAQRITQLAFFTIWNLTNSSDKPTSK